MSYVDNRSVAQGKTMWSGPYCDQPYVVPLPDGQWVSVLTIADNHEGDVSQQIVSMRSSDQGATWSKPLPIEDGDGREASWALPLVFGGRVFVFYTFNAADLRVVPSAEGPSPRVDTLGEMMMRYSDDGGEKWSDRISVPIRTFAVDEANDFGGEVHYWWAVGKPLIIDDAVFLSGSKVGRFDSLTRGFQADTEGFLLRSDDLLAVNDPAEATWITLPEGDIGIKGSGTISEEHKLVSVGGDGLSVVFRTDEGGIGQAVSRDRGETWTKPDFARFASGAVLKHPRAASFAWNYAEDRYLLWFHNNANGGYGPFRNPAWLVSGRIRGGRIMWSEPEIALYDHDPLRSMSYPDLIVDPEGFFLTETDKRTARVHKISHALIHALESQWDGSAGADIPGAAATRMRSGNWTAAMPRPEFWRSVDAWTFKETGEGFTIALSLNDEALDNSSVILSTLQTDNRGWSVQSLPGRRMRITLCDGRLESSWTTDPVENGVARIAFIVDGGAKVLMCVVNGRLQDGDDARGQGWGRFPRELHHAKGSAAPTIQAEPAAMSGEWHLYDRAVFVSEAVLWTREATESGR